MIKQIQLEKFKSYDYSAIDLAPITLLCGGNSSGKTSIIKSILLMKQSFEATGGNYLLINGEYTSNGLYSNLRNKSGTDTGSTEMGISVSFVIEKDNPSFKDICRSIGMVSRKNHFRDFEVHASFVFDKNPNFPQVGEIKSSKITFVSNYAADSLLRGDFVISKICMERCDSDQHYTINLENFPTPLYSRNKAEYPFKYLTYKWEECTCYFRGMQLVSLYKEGIPKAEMNALQVLYTIFRALASEHGKINYIGPLRETPLRQYLLQNVYSEIGVKGENTAQYLGQFGDKEVYTHLPDSKEPQKVMLKYAVKEWARFLGIDEVSAITSGIPGAQITQIMIGEQNIVGKTVTITAVHNPAIDCGGIVADYLVASANQHDRFPQSDSCASLNAAFLSEVSPKRLSDAEKKPYFKKYGNEVASRNGYAKKPDLSRKNPSYSVFIHPHQEYYLSIDLEHGGLEVFQYHGSNPPHLGEYDFSCQFQKGAEPETHKIIV